jgi:hypothetical protein
MKAVLRTSAMLSSIALITIPNAYAGGFTSGKGIYDFAAEYQGSFAKNLDTGESYSIYAQDIEINNEFGITEDQSIGIDIFLTKEIATADQDYLLDTDPGAAVKSNWDQSFQTRHRMNFNVNESVNLGLQNAVGFFDDGFGVYNMRYELRGMVRHDAKEGFYKYSRAELSYRRNFQYNLPDTFRLDLRAKFRLHEKVDLFMRLNTYFRYASQSFINANETSSNDKGLNNYGFSTLKVSDSEFFIGPEFKLKNDQSIYVYYYSKIDGAKNYRNHAKGLAVGYTISVNL